METTLLRLGIGKIGLIKGIIGGMRFQTKIRALGIRPGKRIMILCRHPFGGPIVVKVDNIKIAIGKGMANRIIVKAV